jgi:hypothetical protein
MQILNYTILLYSNVCWTYSKMKVLLLNSKDYATN